MPVGRLNEFDLPAIKAKEPVRHRSDPDCTGAVLQHSYRPRGRREFAPHARDPVIVQPVHLRAGDRPESSPARRRQHNFPAFKAELFLKCAGAQDAHPTSERRPDLAIPVAGHRRPAADFHTRRRFHHLKLPAVEPADGPAEHQPLRTIGRLGKAAHGARGPALLRGKQLHGTALDAQRGLAKRAQPQGPARTREHRLGAVAHHALDCVKREQLECHAIETQQSAARCHPDCTVGSLGQASDPAVRQPIIDLPDPRRPCRGRCCRQSGIQRQDGKHDQQHRVARACARPAAGRRFHHSDRVAEHAAGGWRKLTGKSSARVRQNGRRSIRIIVHSPQRARARQRGIFKRNLPRARVPPRALCPPRSPAHCRFAIRHSSFDIQRSSHVRRSQRTLPTGHPRP